MDNYVRVYKNMLDEDLCETIIEKFEKNIDQHDKHIDGKVSFTQINLGAHKNWEQEHKIIFQRLLKCVEKYANECNITPKMWPKTYGYESIRMKRYLANDIDVFPEHVDVSNYKNARRFLVFFAYLDSNKRGATHVKPKDDLFISDCKQGSVLVFPPLWPWIHEGRKPVEKPKYIIGSYLHYV